MKCHVVKHRLIEVGLEDISRSYEDRAGEDEKKVIEASVMAFLAGKSKPISTLDIGTQIAKTGKAVDQVISYDKGNPHRRIYSSRERPFEVKDVMLAKLVEHNQFGGDEELDERLNVTEKDFTPRVRICFNDGSQAEVPLVGKLKKAKVERESAA